MTERKPPDIPFESWVERQIHEAVERGEFDNLPGAGKPLPGVGGGIDDEDWWLRGFLAREDVPTDALLPTSLQLRKEIELLPETVRDLPTEDAVRQAVAALNARVMEYWRSAAGPHVPVRLANADTVVQQWRAALPSTTESSTTQPSTTEPAKPALRVPWWRRIFPKPGGD